LLFRTFRLFTLLLIVLLLSAALPGAVMPADGAGGEKRAGQPLITESGFVVGYGNADNNDGSYRTLLLIYHMGMDVNRFIPAFRDHKGTLSCFLEPQFNPVLSPSSNYEYGLGIGIQYAYPVTEIISPYILGVTGPQYISAESPIQAGGLNFASAAGAGLYLRLTRDVALNLGYRYRHVSNANIKTPNGGINSQIGLVGISFFF
jgi:lipid A 3-O-deacylase